MRGVAAGGSAQRGTSGAANGGGGAQRSPDPEALCLGPLVLEAFEDGHAVLAAEAEAVDEDVVDGLAAWFPGHVVEIALGVGRELVDGGRDAAGLDCFH